MDESKFNNNNKRRYPGLYEKGVPIILAAVVFLVIILIGIALAVIFHII